MPNDFEALNADELYLLHLDITAVLKQKLVAKKDSLERQLRQLHPTDDHTIMRSRRPYPPVSPKLQKPDSRQAVSQAVVRDPAG